MPNPTDDDTVEMRFNVPRWIAEVVDAHCLAKRVPRTDQARSILAQWARSEIHLATIVGRVTRGKGDEKPSDWGELDA